MKKIILTLALILSVTINTSAHPNGPGVTKAKVAELTSHRIDRLVSLNKIDKSFLTKLVKMEVSVLENQEPAYYKVHVTQTQPTQGQAQQMDVIFDDDGKPLSYSVIPGGASGPDDGWTGVDPVTISENALHYVLENGETDAKVKPFYTGLTTVSLEKGLLNGQITAKVQMTSAETNTKLNVYLNLDGTFISTNFTD